MDLEKEFEQCYKRFFPVQDSLMGLFSDMMNTPFSRQFYHPSYVENNIVTKVDSYDLEDGIFGGIIMKVAFGMFDGDLEYLLSKFNGGAEFNRTMREVYMQHHKL